MRLDALNRIGNQVFHKDLNRPENYALINAPVNYPHIWTSSWFDWVQYDGSIMQPLVRNAGEALGVNVVLDVSSPVNEKRFSSSIPLENLMWMEEALSGNSFADMVHNKLKQGKISKPAPYNYERNGLFILDTTLAGNSNKGHEFSDDYNPSKLEYDPDVLFDEEKRDEYQKQGVIGPKLDEQQRKAIIEYLKTL